MIDTSDESLPFIELGTTSAFNWQQGSMLQWRPGSPTEVLWNDREEGAFVTRVLDVETRELRTLDQPRAVRTEREPQDVPARTIGHRSGALCDPGPIG